MFVKIAIAIVSIICGLLAIVILVMLRNYLKRYHIDLFHALRFYTERQRPPQTLMEYKAVRWTVEFVKALAEKIPQLRFIVDLTPKIRRAGLPILGAEFVAILLLSAILAGVITYALTLSLLFALIAAVVIVVAEWLSIYVLIQRRREKFTNQLGDCLTTVSNALRAGFSFLQAMDLVSREMEPPISEEFAHVMRDISYGMDLDQALLDMNERVDSPDFNLVVTAVLIQNEVGGNLAQVLDTISDTINDRIRMRREIMTITAQGRMSSWVLGGLPIFLVAAQLAIDPTHFDEMLDNSFGRIAIIAAVILEIIGFIIIRKIVNIKVE